MASQKLNTVLRGFSFIIAIVIYLMCERWMIQIKVPGTPSYRPHVFKHTFLLWTIKQCCLALLFLVWKGIDQNWCGMKRFMHADVDEDAEPHKRLFLRHASVEQDDGRINTDNAADTHLIPQDPPRARIKHGKKKTYTFLLFILPSAFNQAHILLVYFGLKLTYPSSVVMLTGTAATFVTLLSLAFLAKQISCLMWFGVSLTTIGFAMSGLSDYLKDVPPGYEPYGIAAGDLLFTMGQITMTTQMVYEEKFMRKLSIHPMKFLGSEGIFDLAISMIMLVAFCLADTQYSDLPHNRIEDISDAYWQFANSWEIRLAFFGSLISYIIFTYLGMILIKDHGAMARIMIEALGWCLYWVILVSIGWEQRYITQVPGLAFVVCGVLIFSCPCTRGNSTLDPLGNETLKKIMGDGFDKTPSQNSRGNINAEHGAVGGVDNDDVMLQVGNVGNAQNPVEFQERADVHMIN